MTAREELVALVAPERPDGSIELARAALLIAAEEYPQLRPEPYLQRLDYLAERVRDHLGDGLPFEASWRRSLTPRCW